MSVVVDTNVVAYFVLGTEPHRDECSTFLRAHPDLRAPASWEAELVNVISLAVRHGVIDAAEGLERLRLASGLGVTSVPPSTLWQGALARAVANQHPPHDTLFVELAVREGSPLATFDARLLELYPRVARRPGALVQYDALVHVLDGVAEISIAGQPHRVAQGELIVMPANVPHALKAVERFKMLLIMIREVAG